ncbi:Retrovirus-related Pol polyprotein from transposon TNT 1-94 [Cucumis melo var. makuwa]|uniref:Retrovirus-related Pol polyprotein from transposon TNT 1-94 n=1 Tax=Cucumis melo var. makuwa TaxID=1194695 RepID=A0A5D3CGF8_CUCMM|nr:Retrovirus-related Pol polyprotein from transposon TNT 1-94 [Cucumis melo var. makuwa]
MEKSEIARLISTILDDSNYITYTNQMKSFLIGRKLWRIVTGDITKPTKQDKEDDNKFIERLEEWDNKNHQIITWLSNTSVPAIHTQFDAFENAKELWNFLSTRFKSVGLAHYYQLHNSLVNLNQEAGQSVNEYLAVLQPIWTQLDQATISKDHLRLIKVLMGLRPEYESVRAALLHRSPLPSLDAAIQEILFEERRLGINLSKHSDAVLASTYSPPGASSTFCKNCKLTGHKFINCPKIECRYCHKPGHILNNCPIKPPRPHNYSTRAKNFTKPSNSSVATVAPDKSITPQFQISDFQSLLNQLISSPSSALAVSPGNRWLLDSGCCNHMTSNYSFMNTPSPTKSLPPIYAADGNCMNITHMGTINTSSLNLPHTYCVPNLTFNLVSVGQLCDLGLTVSFSSNGCQVPPPSISALVTDSDTYQWLLRLGHASPEKLRHLISINNLNSITKFVPFNCLNCKLAKQPALSFSKSTSICDKPFDLIHSDIWGPAPTSIVHGYRYYVLFIDDFSRFTWIYFLKHRSELSRTYIEFANMIRTQFSCPIKTLRTDNALEYKDSTLLSFLSQHGTLVQRSCPHTSQQNGRAERKHRHILDSVQALLLSASCPEKFWGEAALTSVYTINHLPSSVLQNISPFERLYGTPPNYSNLKVFDCACFVLLHPHEHTKLKPRARLCCFLGYGTEHKGFRCWDPLFNRLRISRHVTFWEHTMFSRLSSFHASFFSPQSFFIDTSIDLFPLSESTSNNELAQSASTSATSDQSSISDGNPDPPPDIPPRRSTRVREPPIHLQDYHCFSTIVSLIEPTSYQEASTDPLWQKAMNDELQALEKMHTWDYVDLPPGKRPIGCKWIYKIKTHSDGTIERYKARLVAKGYSQEYGIDYEETFAHVARMTSVRCLLGVAAAKQWPLLQMDVKNAFLNGTPSEEVYMKPPPGTSSPPHKGIVLLLLYVDDMIITGNDPQAISDLQHYLGQHFEMEDLGSLNYFLGLEVSRRSDGYLLSQAKYASDLLARSGITDSNTASTPLDPNVHLTPYDGVPLENVSLYRQLVGSLIYLTVTHPDIAYVVHIVSQFMAAPRTIHFTVVLRILRYVKGTLGHGLQFSSQSSLVLSGYFDADWAGDPTDRRSTTGYCFYLGDSLISWRSKKQSVVSRSSTESEYRALADATTELLWLRWLLADMGVPQQGPTLLHCDNRSAIQIAHNDVFHERTKHIENDCHFIRHHLLSHTLLLQPVSTTEQPADIFTKALPSTRFNQIRTKLRLTATLPP